MFLSPLEAHGATTVRLAARLLAAPPVLPHDDNFPPGLRPVLPAPGRREERAFRGPKDTGFLHRPDHVQELGAPGTLGPPDRRNGSIGRQEAARCVLAGALHDPAASVQLRPPGQGAAQLLRVLEG